MENALTNNSAACGQSRSTVVLERCPFCNGEAAFGKTTYSRKTIREQHWGQDTFHSVNCISCGTSNRGLVGYRTQDEAAAHWNKRSNVEFSGQAELPRSSAGTQG